MTRQILKIRNVLMGKGKPMLFWIREIAGWALVVVSLVMIRLAIQYVSVPVDETPGFVQAAVMMFGALGVLRMGILLVRISTAARICLKEQPRAVTAK